MGLKDVIQGLFGKKPTAVPEPIARVDPERYQTLLDETHAAMDRHWQKVGYVESDVIAEIIPSVFMGGPAWPTIRQAYRIVRRENSILLTTDGMSDPFDEEGADVPGNGFGMELFIETADIPAEFAGSRGDVAEIKHAWAFELLDHLAAVVADRGGIREDIEGSGCISTELPGVSDTRAIKFQVPERFITDDDSIGLLFGGPAPDFPSLVPDAPQRPVMLIPVVLLTADELSHIRANGREGRAQIIEALKRSPVGFRSDLTRSSVL